MQLAAWNNWVGSGLFTGIREEQLRTDFEIPEELSPTDYSRFWISCKGIDR